MKNQLSSGLKNTFLIHFVVALIFGLVFLLIPDVWVSLANWTIKDPGLYRLLGAALLAFGFSSWYAYKAETWEQVKIIVQTELVWTLLGTLTSLWGVLSGALPAFAWINVVILAAFGIAFWIFYSQNQAGMPAPVKAPAPIHPPAPPARPAPKPVTKTVRKTARKAAAKRRR